MTYARIENGAVVEYPVYEGDLRLRFRNVSFPVPFSPPEGYEPVVDVTPPQIDHTQNLVEGEPALEDGAWMRRWVITAASAEEVAERTEAKWAAIRSERNRRLAACDWTQLPDAPVDATVWTEYRQSLRDITLQQDPFNITWPVQPGEAL